MIIQDNKIILSLEEITIDGTVYYDSTTEKIEIYRTPASA